MTTYLSLSCLIPSRLEEELPDLLASLPIRGSLLEPAGAQWVLATVYLDEGRGAEAGELARLLEAHGAVRVQTETVLERDWLAAYRDRVRAFPVGRVWWMDPHPDAPTPAPEGRIRLAVEPRSAFGTGSHESTQLVLAELEELAVDRATVLDVGTGSGVLCLAAERLGADWVLGVDVDPEAVWVARQIAAQQDWDSRAAYVVGSAQCLGRGLFQVVLCNMIAEQLLPLLEDLRRLLAVGGVAIFSGILGVQDDAVREELEAAGLRVIGQRTLGDWLCLRLTRV